MADEQKQEQKKEQANETVDQTISSGGDAAPSVASGAGGDSLARARRTDTDIDKVPTNPNFLAAYIEEDTSLDALEEHVSVPRFKLIQPTTEAELKSTFGEGSAIVRPGDTLVVKYEGNKNMDAHTEFDFVPLFFFKEWATWRDLKGSGPMILDRSFDPGSNIAVWSKNKKTRKVPYAGHEHLQDSDPSKLYNSHVEHIRFLGTVYGDHPLAGTPVVLSFERGEWSQGQNFIDAIGLRRIKINDEYAKMPLWSQVWRMKTVYHNPEADKKWFGFSFEAAPQSVINPDEADAMKGLHTKFRDLHKKSLLTVQDDEQTSPDEAAVKECSQF